MFKNMKQVMKANKDIGHHWFSKDTMRFFNSRVESELIEGKYFITSEDNFNRDARLYSVRIVNKDGTIDTVGEFLGYKTKQAALEAIQEFT